MTAHDKALEAALDAFYDADAGDSGLEPHARELRDMQRAITAYHAALEGQGEGGELDELVNKFLAWQLPQSVCSDLCVTDKDYKFPRYGTNLLNADEARQMIKEVFVPALAKCREETIAECAKVADAVADAVMKDADKAHRKKNYDLYEELECQASVAGGIASGIRALASTGEG